MVALSCVVLPVCCSLLEGINVFGREDDININARWRGVGWSQTDHFARVYTYVFSVDQHTEHETSLTPQQAEGEWKAAITVDSKEFYTRNMTSNTDGPLKLLPPPPPPPPPQTPAKVSLIAHLPPECRPKVEPLLHLMVNIDNDDCFDEKERENLRNSQTGNEIMNILASCREDRSKTMASMKLLEESGDEENEKAHEMNLLRFQTCLLRKSCPGRMSRFENCWTKISRRMIREQRTYAVSRFTCQSERQALERCAGSLVSRSVREAMEDSALADVDDF
jgi:hypothetical protein